MKTVTKLWVGIAVLIFLSPLGLILPKHFKAGSSWGEWGADEMRKRVWSAPLPDYAFKGRQEKGLARLSIAYIISAFIGIVLIIVVVLFLGKILTKKGR